ncbi:MAG: methyltransferase [Opitutaceae bacterium]
MSWQQITVADCGTHHLVHGAEAYRERFDDVLKFHAPGLAPVCRAGDAWHIHADGSAAYDHRYLRTFGFYDDLAAVVTADGWCHIKPTGMNAYTQRHAWCGNFQEGRCPVRDADGSYYHINHLGQPLYEKRWNYVGDFKDGIAVVQRGDGQSSHVDSNGGLLHDCWFLDLDVFHKGFARARDDEGWGHANRSGLMVYARRFASVEPFYNGQARVECFDGALQVIDESGSTIVQLRAPLRSEFATLSADMVGYWKTQTIYAGVELGVYDALPGASDQIASQLCLIQERLERLLRGLQELGLVLQTNGTWELTLRGQYLRTDHPETLADAAREYARPFSEMWESLPEALRTTGAWERPDVFGDVARDQSRKISHHRMLQSYARHDYPNIAEALCLSGCERVIDAGGGLGVMAHLLIDAYPESHVTVLERPEVVAQAQGNQVPRAGVDWLAGDLFKPWNCNADVVVLARILHDWDDAAAGLVLKGARASLPWGGQLFVVEMLMRDDSAGGALCDIHLLMATGGQERSIEGYRTLFNENGFELSEVRSLTALSSILVGVAQ